MNQTHTDMTKLNKNFEKLVQREFDPQETLQVLKNPPMVWWSWGVERCINYHYKGLILIVNGNHHKGIVFIRLSWNDTYTYFLINDDGSIKKELNEVYFDELQERIDKDIEYINDYN